ncbi:MAG TPA: cytochrome c oxidase assembly protein [Acidimicrobiales bacterium]|nr:cytochrome c oxidase assembly protein [Acidimicrobiales bacterium]
MTAPGLRGLDAVAGLRGLNAVAVLRGLNAVAGLPPLSWSGALTRWELDPVVLVGATAAALAYRAGCRASGAVPAGRRAAFASGLAVTVVALCSPVAVYGELLFSVHMVQHLLLSVVAAPLLVAGRPVAVVGALLDPPRRRELLRLRRAPVVGVLGHPIVAWVTFAAAGWVAHFSPLYGAALDHPWVHVTEHALFLGSALLFWRAVLGAAARWRLSHPLRLLYLAVAMPQSTFLALAIWSSSRPLYPRYVEIAERWGIDARADQRLAGGIMWVAGDLVLLGAVLAVAGAWASHEQRVTARREALEDDVAALGPAASPSG